MWYWLGWLARLDLLCCRAMAEMPDSLTPIVLLQSLHLEEGSAGPRMGLVGVLTEVVACAREFSAPFLSLTYLGLPVVVRAFLIVGLLVCLPISLAHCRRYCVFSRQGLWRTPRCGAGPSLCSWPSATACAFAGYDSERGLVYTYCVLGRPWQHMPVTHTGSRYRCPCLLVSSPRNTAPAAARQALLVVLCPSAVPLHRLPAVQTAGRCAVACHCFKP